MTAATKDRDLNERAGVNRGFPVAATTKIYAGTMVAVNSSGNLVPGSTSNALKCVGVAKSSYDNSAGAAGDIVGEAFTGVYGPFANSTSTDAIADADVTATCYMVDDSTVAKTSNSSARSAAGTVFKVTTDGVWVRFVV